MKSLEEAIKARIWEREKEAISLADREEAKARLALRQQEARTKRVRELVPAFLGYELPSGVRVDVKPVGTNVNGTVFYYSLLIQFPPFNDNSLVNTASHVSPEEGLIYLEATDTIQSRISLPKWFAYNIDTRNAEEFEDFIDAVIYSLNIGGVN
jgi:hypothetical protein